MLTTLRNELDSLDSQISKLLIKRLNVTKQIGKYKKDKGWKSITDTERERIVIDKAIVCTDNVDEKEAIKAIYKVIISEGKKLQERILNK